MWLIFASSSCGSLDFQVGPVHCIAGAAELESRTPLQQGVDVDLWRSARPFSKWWSWYGIWWGKGGNNLIWGLRKNVEPQCIPWFINVHVIFPQFDGPILRQTCLHPRRWPHEMVPPEDMELIWCYDWLESLECTPYEVDRLYEKFPEHDITLLHFWACEIFWDLEWSLWSCFMMFMIF